MAGGQQQQGQDNSLDFFWGIALVLVAGLAIWYFGRVYVVTFIFKIRYFEVLLIDYTLSAWATVASTIGLPTPDVSGLVTVMQALDAGVSNDIPFAIVAEVSNTVGWYLAFPIAVILGVMAIVVYSSSVGGKFKRVHSMKTLRTSEARLWHAIAPVKDLDLIKVDIDKGPWAMALTPMMWAKRMKLLKEDRTQNPIAVTVIKGMAAKQFAMQLGPYFTKFEALPPHVQALFAIFSARACRDRKASDALLEQLSYSSATGQINYSGARALAAKHLGSKEVGFAVSRHAYVSTLMCTMLELARTDGVLATAEFLWLKPVDRRLWYTLTSVGRQTPYVEVAGIFAHWLVEKKVSRPMRVPMVDEAVSALEIAIKDIIYEPDEEDNGDVVSEGESNG